MFSNSNRLSVYISTSPLVYPDPYHLPLYIKFSLVFKLSDHNIHNSFDFKFGDFTSMSNFSNYFDWESIFSLYFINDAATVFNDAHPNGTNKNIHALYISTLCLSKCDLKS